MSRERLPLLATTVVCALLYLAAGFSFAGFFSLRVAVNFLEDNAFLGVIAVGLTFVILTGGIDLSVGAMVGCSGIMVGTLIQHAHLHPLIAFGAALAFGLAVGTGQGLLIQRFALAPFLVTLAGLFFCHGIALWISRESVQIDHPFFDSLVDFSIPLPGKAQIHVSTIVFLLVLIIGAIVAKQTRFGRTVYAIGGSEPSANLMGLPVARTKVAIYALSGFCSALGGILFTLYTSSGNALAGTGSELDAIAAVVIGGTLLTGGYGSVFGSFLGVMILGIIQTGITFQGTLSSWWTRIVIGGLLLVFMLMQKGIERLATRRST